jgi:hypothetical protein
MPPGVRAKHHGQDQEKRDGRMTDKELKLLVQKHADECVLELCNTVRKEGQMPWFIIVEREMMKLAKQLRRKPKGK